MKKSELKMIVCHSEDIDTAGLSSGEISPAKNEERNSLLQNETFVSLLFVTH